MKLSMFRAKVKKESASVAEAGVKRMFAAIGRAQPDGIRYASTRLLDGLTYVALLQVDDGVENPLPGIPEWREFQENLKSWAEPATREELEVVGSYRLFESTQVGSPS